MSQSTTNKDDSTFLHLPGQYTHRPNQGEMSECVVGSDGGVLTMKSEHWIPTLASIERSGGGGWTGRVFVRGCSRDHSRDHSRPISGEWKISSPSNLQSTFLYPIFLTHFHQHFPQSFNLNIKIFRPSHISWIYTARIKRSGKSTLHLFCL